MRARFQGSELRSYQRHFWPHSLRSAASKAPEHAMKAALQGDVTPRAQVPRASRRGEDGGRTRTTEVTKRAPEPPAVVLPRPADPCRARVGRGTSHRAAGRDAVVDRGRQQPDHED